MSIPKLRSETLTKYNISQSDLADIHHGYILWSRLFQHSRRLDANDSGSVKVQHSIVHCDCCGTNMTKKYQWLHVKTKLHLDNEKNAKLLSDSVSNEMPV